MTLERFSRFQKWILIAIAAALVLPMGVLGIYQSVLTEKERDAAWIFGKGVSGRDMAAFRSRWLSLARINRQLGRSLGLLEQDGLNRYFVLTQVAQRSGIEVSDQEVARRALSLLYLPQDATQSAYEKRLAEVYRIPVSPFEQAIRELIACDKFTRALLDSMKVGPAELWQYCDENLSKAKVDLITIPATLFADKVAAPTDDDIRALYEQDRTTPWLLMPRRLRVEYAGALYETWKPLAEIEASDIEAYYERKKADFLIPRTADDKETPEQTDATDSGETGTEAETPEKPRFRPLEDVRGEIESVLRARHAASQVNALILKAREEASRYGLAETAKLNGLRHGTTPLFNEAQAADVPILGVVGDRETLDDSLGHVAFTMGEGDYGIVRNGLGEFVIHIIEDEAAYPPSLAEVKEKIEERLRTEKCFRAAQDAARSIAESVRSGASLDEAAKSVNDGLKVTESDLLSPWSPGAYAAEASRSPLGTVSVSSDETSTPPCAYVWKVVERIQPDRRQFDRFRDFYGAFTVLRSEYGDLMKRLADDVMKYADFRTIEQEEAEKQSESDAGNDAG